MARPKQPLERAEITGATLKDPGRYRGRRRGDPSRSLGGPSSWMSEERGAIWEEFKSEVPWLQESDRGMVELVVVLTERMRNDTITVSELGQLRLCLSACGATPASRNGIAVPEDEDEDALAEFLN